MIKIDEKHLEDILFNEIKSEGGFTRLSERGLELGNPKHYKVFRQVNLGDYGIPDIVLISFQHRFIQIRVIGRYVTGINTMLEQQIELKVVEFNVDHLFQYKFSAWRVSVYGTLIVAGYKPNGSHWLCDFLKDVSIYTTEYNLNGLSFESQIHSRWVKTKADHNLHNYFDVMQCREQYKNSYREYLTEVQNKKVNSNG